MRLYHLTDEEVALIANLRSLNFEHHDMLVALAQRLHDNLTPLAVTPLSPPHLAIAT